MTKQIRNIVISCCVIVVLVAVVLLLKFLPGKKPATGSSSTAASSNTTIAVTNTAAKDVKAIKVTNANGGYTITNSGTDSSGNPKWSVDGLSSVPLNTSALSSTVTNATQLKASKIVTSSASSLDEYGLSKPAATIEVDAATPYKLYLGVAAPSGNGYYMMREGDSRIYMVDSTISTFFTYRQFDYVSTGLTSINGNQPGKLTDLVFAGASRPQPIKLHIDKTSEQTLNNSAANSAASGATTAKATYDMTSPGKYNANSDNTDSLITTLTSLIADKVVTLDVSPKTLDGYGLTNPAYTLTYTFNGTENELLFGNTYQDNGLTYVYTMVKGRNVVYALSTTSAKFYNWQLTDIASTLVFTPNIDDVKSVKVEAGSKSYSFDLSGTSDALKVTAGSKTLNTANFRNFYEYILNNYIQGTADQPKDAQTICKVTIDYRDATRSEDVLVFQKIDDYKAFMMIDGSGSFYVKSSAIGSMIQAAQDVTDGKTVSEPQ